MTGRFDLSREEMREAGYRVVDMIVEHLSGLQDAPVGRKADPSVLLPRYSEPAPNAGVPLPDLLEQLKRDILPNTMHVNHPRFFAYVPGPSNFISVLADTIAAAYNVFAGTWISGSGAAAIELETIGWLRDACGFPEGGGGLFVSGGTMANVLGLAVARHAILNDRMTGAVLYCSGETHFSLQKAVRLLGFGPEQTRVLPCDREFRLPVDVLQEAIRQDRARGLRPFCVIANAGATNTGAVDPLSEIAALVRSQEMWLHVDGAYGAAAAICERGRAALRGIEDADSLSLDPHKWLFQPFEIGCLLVRDIAQLRAAFRTTPDILKDTHGALEDFNFTDYGLQLTRSFRALKLWLSIRYFGMDVFRAAIEHGFAMAEYTEQALRRKPQWEVITPAQMGIVSFRFRGADDRFHLRLVPRIQADGFAFVTSTVLGGNSCLRMCPIHPSTTELDIDRTLDRLTELAEHPAPERAHSG